MKTLVFSAAACLFLCFCSCRKTDPSSDLSTPGSGSTFTQFVIPKGQHYASENGYKPIETAELKFVVRFDSSAIYKTANPENQYDINKLYGFSDNGQGHQSFSARFGWRWSDEALRLFAYTYNYGKREEKELGIVNIGEEIHCSIKVMPEAYFFTLNKTTETMARQSVGPVAKGYRLYPYFGGDENAPHDVRIWIREEK